MRKIELNLVQQFENLANGVHLTPDLGSSLSISPTTVFSFSPTNVDLIQYDVRIYLDVSITRLKKHYDSSYKVSVINKKGTLWKLKIHITFTG
jgi:hypothetical protein